MGKSTQTKRFALKSKFKSKFLTQIDTNTFKYHEPLSFEGMNLAITFTIKKRSDDGWFTDSLDVEGETPAEVVENYFQQVKEIARYEAQCG